MKDKREYVNNLLLRAENDLASARHLLTAETPATDVICFHCQQTVEKLLKAWLYWNGVSAPRTHSLAELLNLSQRFEIGFANMGDVEILTPYAVETRYADDFYQPSLEEAIKAVNLSGKADQFIRDSLRKDGF